MTSFSELQLGEVQNILQKTSIHKIQYELREAKTTHERTWMAAKLTANTRVVNDAVVNSGPSASSINHDKRSFYETR